MGKKRKERKTGKRENPAFIKYFRTVWRGIFDKIRANSLLFAIT